MGWVKTSIIAVIVVGFGLVCGTALAAGQGGYEILSSSDDGVTFRVKLPHYSLDTLVYDGVEYIRPSSSDLVPFAGEDEPDLGLFPIVLAVPPGAEVELGTYSLSEVETIRGVRILPVPRIGVSKEGPGGLPVYTYEEDRSIYGSSGPFPARSVELADRGRLRHQEVVRVLVCPFAYDPVGAALSVAREITVTVKFTGARGFIGVAPADDAWEGVYKEALVNYEAGRSWRSAAPRMLLMGAAPTNARVRMYIDSTGVYRIGYAALAALGFPGSVPVEQVYMYRDFFKEGSPDTIETVEYAITLDDNDADGIFSAGDSITFFAQNFYDQFGSRGGEDYFFNRNVYWLTWGEGEHRRIATEGGWREAAAPAEPVVFKDYIHVEKDSLFMNYPPNGDIDLYWWRRLQSSFPFELPGVDNSYGAVLTIKFVNAVANVRANALMHFLVRGCSGPLDTIGTIAVAVPSITTYEYGVDPGVLCEEGNAFRFESKLDSRLHPGNCLDWFEVAYSRRYEASDDELLFTNGDVEGEVEFSVKGFSSRDIMLYDVTDSTNPVGIVLEAARITAGEEGFDAAFRDSLAAGAAYIALTGDHVLDLPPENMELTGPPRLRDVVADEIMIGYPDFVPELDPLVELRESQGLAVTVATTQEVYDDFGNGIKSDTAIKRYIERCYLNGDAQFVLLVGDANTDRRGVQLGIPFTGLPPYPSDVDYLPSHNIYVAERRSYPNNEIDPNEMWFVTMDGEGDNFPDLYIGRLSVGSIEQASGVVAKILAFENYQGSDPWKKRLLAAADDYYSDDPYCYQPADRAFQQACDSLTYIARNYAVVAPDTAKYYLRRCTQADQTAKRTDQSGACLTFSTTYLFTRSHCTPTFLGLLNQGAFIVNYEGHSNMQQFTHELLIRDYDYVGGGYRDVRDLHNTGKPFVFLGYGCWMSNFHAQSEGALTIGDTISEKFVLNANGGACAAFGSAAADGIYDNLYHNQYTIRAIFTHLQGMDPQGNPIPARVLFGEAIMTGLLRFTVPSRPTFAKTHILFADPAMVMDMGPPIMEVTADGEPAGGSYVYTGSDTLDIVADIRDEEAIMSIDLDLVEGTSVTAVPSEDYISRALVDTAFTRSRAYEVVYHHMPRLGDYQVRITGEDYSGKPASSEIRIQTGSAAFFKEGAVLNDGDAVVFGQNISIEISRPVSMSEGDIEAFVDSIPASDFEDYSLQMLDGEGKRWKVTFLPSLEAGDHMVTVRVGVLSASRNFEYVPARVDVFADDKMVLDEDFISPVAEFKIVVLAGAGITPEDLSIALDDENVPAAFEPSDSVLTASFGVNLEPGEHELRVQVFGVAVSRVFRVSDELSLTGVSVFPSPFADETLFFYTLSQDAGEVTLRIYTVSGRLIYDADLPNTAGYNTYRWDGRDRASDRIANGTYFYRIVAKTGSREREATGWVVKAQ